MELHRKITKTFVAELLFFNQSSLLCLFFSANWDSHLLSNNTIDIIIVSSDYLDDFRIFRTISQFRFSCFWLFEIWLLMRKWMLLCHIIIKMYIFPQSVNQITSMIAPECLRTLLWYWERTMRILWRNEKKTVTICLTYSLPVSDSFLLDGLWFSFGCIALA